MVSGSKASIDALVLLWVWLVGPSAGDAVTELMRMLVAAALFLQLLLVLIGNLLFIVSTGYPYKGYIVLAYSSDH